MAFTPNQFKKVMELVGLSTLPETWSPLNSEIVYFVTDDDDNPLEVNPHIRRYRFDNVKNTMDVVKVRLVKNKPSHEHYDQWNGNYYEYLTDRGELQYDTYHITDIYNIELKSEAIL